MPLCGVARDRGAVLWSLDTPVVSIGAAANGTWWGHYSPGGQSSTSALQFSARLPLQLEGTCGFGPSPSRRPFDAFVLILTSLGNVDTRYPVFTRSPSSTEAAVWESTYVAAIVEFSIALPSASGRNFSWRIELANGPHR